MIIDKILALNLGFIETFGYILTFLATFLESSPFIGLFVPGSIVILVGGFIAKLGFLNLWVVMAFAILGAIFGDLVGYIFGRYFGKEFLHKYGKYFLIKKEYIDRSCEIVNNHSGKSLVLGRLNPLTRSAAPFIVGANKTPFGRFMFFNVLGGILWGFLFVSLGYILGESYKVAEHFEKYILMATIGLALVFYIYHFIKLFSKKSGKNCLNGTNSKK